MTRIRLQHPAIRGPMLSMRSHVDRSPHRSRLLNHSNDYPFFGCLRYMPSYVTYRRRMKLGGNRAAKGRM